MPEIQRQLIEAAKVRNSRQLADLEGDFGLQASACADFSALLHGDCTQAIDVHEVLQLAKTKGRVLVSARGGAGKSTFLRRLEKVALDSGMVTALVDLATWDEKASHAPELGSDTGLLVLDVALGRFASIKEHQFDLAMLDALPPQVEKLILVDGLNEMPSNSAVKLLAACDAAAAVFPNTSVIVSDRLTRRVLPKEDRWAITTILPLTDAQIDRFINRRGYDQRKAALLDSPYFLKEAIAGRLQSSPVGTILDGLFEHASLDNAESRAVASVAFDAYLEHGSRTFPKAMFASKNERTALEKLQLSMFLREAPGEAGQVFFKHHLIHDALAALHVASDHKLWTEHSKKVLNALTLEANSFDAVAFVMELLADPQRNSSALQIASFLQSVYDWHPYAAGYALADVDGNELIVPSGIRTIVLGMLALRKFDRQEKTIQRATDALALFRDPLAEAMYASESLADLIKVVVEVDPLGDETFQCWKEIFTLEPGRDASSELVARLEDTNSIQGWTAANVIKRLVLSPRLKKEVLRLSGSQIAVVRWRAAHVLGAFGDAQSVSCLLRLVLRDDDIDVRLGAIRSLIEIAVTSRNLRSSVLEGIEGGLDKIRSQRKVLDELVSAIFVVPQSTPRGWAGAVAPIFKRLIDLSETAIEIERWSGLASSLEARENLVT